MSDEEALEAKIDHAADLFDEGRLTAALTAIDECLDQAPDCARAHALRGYIFVRQGDLDAGKVSVERALANDPELSLAHFVFGLLMRLRGDLDSAILAYVRALDLDPHNLHILSELVLTYFQNNQIEKGHHLLEGVKAADPFNLEVLLLRAQTAVLDGNREEAASCASAALKLAPANEDAHLILARIALDGEEAERAEEHATSVLERNPENRDALLILIDSFTQREEYDLAISAIDRQLSIFPEDYQLLALQGWILLLAERIEDAKVIIDRALSLEPNYAYGHYVKGILNRERGDILGTIESFEKSLDQDPQQIDVMKALAVEYRQLGDKKKIRKIIKDIRGAAEPAVETLLFLAELSHLEGNQAEARKFAQAALEVDPDSITAHLAAVNVDLLQMHFEAAREHVQFVLDRDPENQEAKSILQIISTTRPGVWLRIQLWFSSFDYEKSSIILYFVLFWVFPAILVVLGITFDVYWLPFIPLILLFSLVMFFKLMDWYKRRRVQRSEAQSTKEKIDTNI